MRTIRLPSEPAVLAPPFSLRLRLDRDALAGNWRALDRLSGAARAGAAVKADAYGLGARQVVPVLRDAGCADWFVAHWGEVPDLLPLVPSERIAVLHGPLTDDDVRFARAVGARPVINSLSQAQRWLDAGGGACHLMVDTGMSRLGVSLDELGDERIARLEIEVCLSHLASGDENVPQNASQLARFRQTRGQLAAREWSLAASPGIPLGPDYHFDLTRPGLALYGGVPRPELAGLIGQVAYPEAAVLQVRDLFPGDRVGYNATFVAERAMRIGVVSVGYADGYLRCWSGFGTFLHDTTPLPVLGRISMDMAAVDLSSVPDCREGDWLGISYALPEAAQVSGLSQYELLTLLGRRFSRG